MGVTPAASVDSFFHEVLTDALEDQGVAISESTECYLVSLLGDFTKARITDEALGLKLAGASSTGDDGERVRTLKEVGDTSLYVSGFFADSLDRQLVAVDYYIGLGEVAYAELARRLTASTVAEVYGELAEKFPRFVDVLTCVRGRIHFDSEDILKLYRQWVQTRSAWVEQRLRRLGVVLPESSGGEGEGGGGYVQ